MIIFTLDIFPTHTVYTRNNMGQKCEGNCGLWVLNEILKKTYPENLKKIVGAVWELPPKIQRGSQCCRCSSFLSLFDV